MYSELDYLSHILEECKFILSVVDNTLTEEDFLADETI